MVLAGKKRWSFFYAITILAVVAGAAAEKINAGRPGVFWHCFSLLLLVYLFAALHCFLNLKNMYAWMYRHRWWIGIGLMIFMVANCFTLSSVGAYNTVIQPEAGSSYGDPILGVVRTIRQDEFLVNLPRMMAGALQNFGSQNSIVCGTTMSGISATGGLYLDYSALRSPASWGYYLFGAAYGSSFFWAFRLIIGALLTYEMFLILTKEKKLYSLLGTALVWFSSFNVWWSFVGDLCSFTGIVVFFYYMINASDGKKRLLFGTMLAIAGADFCTELYPAWQVPLGWLLIALLVWIMITCQNWKQYHWTDWLIIAVDIGFMISIIVRFLQVDTEYLHAIMDTVYPGERISTGGFSLDKLLGYSAGAVMPLVEIGVASEAGTFFGTFPAGIVLPFYVLRKQTKKNILMICLLVPVIVLLLYCSTGLPYFLAKILLLTTSIPERAVDILGLGVTILFVVSLCDMEECGSLKPIYALGLSLLSGILGVIACAFHYSLHGLMAAAAVEVLCVIGLYFLFTARQSKQRRILLACFSGALILNALMVHPVSVGLDAITAKPLYTQVRSIVQNNSSTKWIAVENDYYANYLIACGAPTLNSTNFVPNKDLWKVLDPAGSHENIWNRYAHLNVSLSEQEDSSYSLVTSDTIQIDLSLKDLKALHVNYICGDTLEIPSSYQNNVKKIYEEDGAVIYEVK